LLNIRNVDNICPSVRMEQLGSHWTDFQATIKLLLDHNLIVTC